MAESKKTKVAKKAALYGIATAVGTFVAPVIGELIADVFDKPRSSDEAVAKEGASSKGEEASAAE